jgi:hypothetical protein
MLKSEVTWSIKSNSYRIQDFLDIEEDYLLIIDFTLHVLQERKKKHFGLHS